jgi:short-subunit dehydrogenase
MAQPLSILITGAGSGLGREAALRLAAAGHRVLAAVQIGPQVTDLLAEARRREVTLQVEKIDLLRASDRSYALRNDIDVLINNAAVSETGPIAEQPIELVREVFDTNVFATLALTQEAVRGMVSRGRGKVIFISSMTGLMTIPYVGAYCASKHALEAIAEALHRELAPHAVQVATFQPGPYRTGFNDRMWDTQRRWFDPARHFTRTADMASTAAILDGQFDPAECVAALVKLVESTDGKFRNVVPQVIEDLIRQEQQEAWTRTM